MFSPQRSTWILAACLTAATIMVFMFRFYDWYDGPRRAMIMVELLVSMLILGRPRRAAVVGSGLYVFTNVVIALAVALWLSSIVRTLDRTTREHEIPLDQGQTAWRSARLLLRGENPYGFGALVDFQAFDDRMPQRQAAGVGPTVPPDEWKADKLAYDRTLAAADRLKLLPPAPSTGPAALEAHLLGYKYGPLFLLMTLPLAAIDVPAGVMALNAAAAVTLMAALYFLMRQRVADARLARMGLAALLCDNMILLCYVEHSATDVWALACSALAVLAYLRGRPSWAAAALAVGFGFKIFPTALVLPMLLKDRRARPILVFAGLAGAIYLPFAWADPMGVLQNVLLWPTRLTGDTTSWLYFAPQAAGPIARVIALIGISAAWVRYLSGTEPSLFRTLAVTSLLAVLSSGAIHNNYVPWASIWIVAALVERFGPAFAGERVRLAQPAVVAPEATAVSA